MVTFIHLDLLAFLVTENSKKLSNNGRDVEVVQVVVVVTVDMTKEVRSSWQLVLPSGKNGKFWRRWTSQGWRNSAYQMLSQDKTCK